MWTKFDGKYGTPEVHYEKPYITGYLNSEKRIPITVPGENPAN